MSRRYLAFIIGINAVVSLTITLLAIWLVELRRPDPEQLAAITTPRPQVILASTPLPATTPVPSQSDSQTSSADAAPTPTSPAVQVGDAYIVQSGDSISGIATRYGVSVNELLEANNLENPDFVFVGQRLFLPLGAQEIPQPSVEQPTQTDAGNQSDAQSSQNVAQPNSQEPGLKITEVQGQGNVDGEFVLIVNDGGAALNLQGWQIDVEGGPSYQFGNFPIFPGGSVRLHSGSGRDSSIDLYWDQEQPVLESGRAVRLADREGQIVNQYPIP